MSINLIIIPGQLPLNITERQDELPRSAKKLYPFVPLKIQHGESFAIVEGSVGKQFV